ncbi:inorganic triphosphatase [Vibrio parahaemolyticus]
METEIELKFFVSPEFSETLRAKISETKVLQHSCRDLGNTYFDTADNWLRQHDIGLRIRRFDDVFVQTVKTAGRVVAGLHQRPEYNAEHTNNEPDLSLHPFDIWPKSGQTDALFTLARSFCEQGGMRLGNLSKAAKGYRLATGYTGDEVKPLSLVDSNKTDTVEYCLINSLEHALSHWHYHEQIYSERDSVEALREISNAIRFIRQTLTIFGGVVPRRASAILRQELKWLEEELVWLDEHAHLEELLDDKGNVLRKLDARKFLVSELTQQLEELPSREEMLTLLSSARYTGLLLDLSRWILARGWQPFLDEKAREKMASNIMPFSVTQLDRTWAELMEAFPAERDLSAQEYVDQRYRLLRNLYTGIGFASLYNFDERNSFRLPWADLVHGIDDLLMLNHLLPLVDMLENEEKEQLERWLHRQERSILHAMDQTRAISVETQPYWREK